jgi:hypothetical protein
LLFLALYVWAFLYGLKPIREYDFWWHLASGRLIAETGGPPFVDPFSLTCRGGRWIDTYWAFEAALYGLSRLGGFNAVVIAASALSVIALWFQQRMLRTLGAGWASRAAVLALFLLSFDPWGHRWVSQSSLVTLAFCSALWAHLEKCRRDGDEPSLALWLPLFAVWANLHRGVVVGVAIAALYALAQTRPGSRSPAPRLAFPLLCAAATLANPYGVGLYRMIWTDFTLSPLHIRGWAAPTWSSQKSYWVTGAALWLTLAREFARGEDVRFHAAAAAFFSALAVRNVVNAPYLSLFALPLVAATASNWFRGRPERRLLAARERAALGGALALTLAGAAAAECRGGVEPSSVPAGACDFIAGERLSGPFYNDYRFGGYFLWRFAGEPAVFIDGRYPAVAGYAELLAAVEKAKKNPGAWADALERDGVHAALSTYPEGAPAAAMFDVYFPRPRWALVYWDDASLLFLERVPENLATIRRAEYTAISPDGGPATMAARARAAGPDERRRIAAELARAAREHPDSRRLADLTRAFVDATAF